MSCASSTQCSLATVTSALDYSGSSDSTIQIIPPRRVDNSQNARPRLNQPLYCYWTHDCSHRNITSKASQTGAGVVMRYNQHNAIRLTNQVQAKQCLHKNVPPLPVYTKHPCSIMHQPKSSYNEHARAYVNHYCYPDQIYKSQEEIRASYPSVIFRQHLNPAEDDWNNCSRSVLRRCSSLSPVRSPTFSCTSNDDLRTNLYIQHAAMDKFASTNQHNFVMRCPGVQKCKGMRSSIRKSTSMPNFERLVIREKIKKFP